MMGKTGLINMQREWSDQEHYGHVHRNSRRDGDVCKSMSKAIEGLLKESREQGIEQGREQGIEIGKNQTLVRLVQKGDLKIERVAAKAKMTVEQFEKMMGNASV